MTSKLSTSTTPITSTSWASSSREYSRPSNPNCYIGFVTDRSCADGIELLLLSMNQTFDQYAVTLAHSHIGIGLLMLSARPHSWLRQSSTLSLDLEVPSALSTLLPKANHFSGNGPYINSTNDTSVKLHIPGKTGGGCVLNGPFVNQTVNMGPGFTTAYQPHCLTRDLAPYFATFTLNSSVVAHTLAATNFFDFDIRVEGGISVPEMTYHGGGHLSVGGDLGEMGNVYSSPGDPLFYLHHANLDRLWSEWQHLGKLPIIPSRFITHIEDPVLISTQTGL